MDLFESTDVSVKTLRNHVQISTYVTILIEYLSPLVTIPVTANIVLQSLYSELQTRYRNRSTNYICLCIEHSTLFTSNKPYFRHLKPGQTDITESLTLFLERVLNSGATINFDDPFKFSLFVSFQ